MSGVNSFILDQAMDANAQIRVGYADEPPGLHEPDARREMRRVEQAIQQFRRNGMRQKMADIAPLGDNFIHCSDIFVAESVHGRKSCAAATTFDEK